MKQRVLVVGGYGNFGQFITRLLVEEQNIQLIIAGRSITKAKKWAHKLNHENAKSKGVKEQILTGESVIEYISLDIQGDIFKNLVLLKPNIVIHTSGPFQNQAYHVAEACIKYGCHYIDLADGREFVCGIDQLNERARERGVVVISGASSVPCLTSTIVDYHATDFNFIDHLDYGITTAQKAPRGVATVCAILGYVGKPFTTLIDGVWRKVFGWQDIQLKQFSGLGWRLLGNCDVPDLELFPKRYPELKTIRFKAGIEVKSLHTLLWLFSWGARWKWINNLQRSASLFHNIAKLFNFFGTSNSAFYMLLTGQDHSGKRKKVSFELVARSGCGVYIPCIPSVLITKKLINGEFNIAPGAYACIGMVTRNEYLQALQGMNIEWHVNYYGA